MVAAVGAQAARPRYLISNGRPLTEQIRPDDRHVVVEPNEDIPLWINLAPGVTPLAHLAATSDVIAVVLVEGLSARLVHREHFANTPVESSRGNWIATEVRVRVQRVLKGTSDAIREGEEWTFEQNGGTIRLETTVVEAVAPNERRLASGSRYLVFGVYNESRFRKSVVYEVTASGQLARMWEPSERRPVEKDPLDLDGTTLEQAIRSLR